MRKNNDYRTLCLGLLLAAVHGLLYVFIVPPWQHYDEPNHFEYTWALATRRTLPMPGGEDVGMRQTLVRSMWDHDFYAGMPFALPELLEQPKPLGLQYSQFGQPPLYYALAAAPVAALAEESYVTQLYGARLVSLGLLLASVLAGWGIMRELSPAGHPLRWMVPLTMALLPGYVDLMTAVNSDVGAVAVFSLFLWGSVCLVRRGFSMGGLVWVLTAAAACWWTKDTAYLALPLAVLVLCLTAFRRARRQWVFWTAVSVGAALGVLAVFSWGDAAGWYRSTMQEAPTQAHGAAVPLGDAAFQIEAFAPVTPAWLHAPLAQPLPIEAAQSLQGKTITLGAWMWASEPTLARTPTLNLISGQHHEVVEITETPTFHSLRIATPDEASRLWITLNPEAAPEATVFYDGVVLAVGEYPLDTLPSFYHADARQGVWGGREFENLLRNPSAEQAGFAVRPWASAFGAKLLPDNSHPAMVLRALLDPAGAWWLFGLTGDNLHQTFWGKFGWGHVTLLGGETSYSVLRAVTLMAVSGAFIFLWRVRGRLPWRTLVVLGGALLGAWGAVLLRNVTYIFFARLFIPSARSAFPAIIPTAMLLCTGILQWLRLAGRWLRFPAKWMPGVYLAAFLCLDVLSIVTIVKYYRG